MSGASDVDLLGGGVAPDLPVLVVDEPVVEVAEVGGVVMVGGSAERVEEEVVQVALVE
jgi:hypothetical protein